MYPNDSPQPIPTGLDYLYQIAPQGPPPRGKNIKIALAIMIVIGMLLVSIILISASQSAQTGPSPLKLAARMQKLQTISQNFAPKLRSTEVQDANSSLNAILLTANSSISEPLLAYEIDLKQQAKSITDLDPTTELEAKLNDAYLNSQLDDTYIREMLFLLEDTLIMMDQLYAKTKVASMRTYMEKTYDDLGNLKKRFESINNDNPNIASPKPLSHVFDGQFIAQPSQIKYLVIS